ncbi:MAG: molybdate ABC transporter permease subunit [Chitinivibrionales bacterium]|nr:molybdate ABC transporter permease subunit [Chitinivibrionales bacterium]MBD3356457.1 molybdate ABC transporter permease subunit [Chitinivibrionales bacterium]
MPAEQDWAALRTTLALASTATVILIGIATPLAWWLARSRSIVAHVVGTLISLPIVLPPTVLGFYLLIIMGPQGPLGPLLRYFGIQTFAFSFAGMVIGSVVHSLPFVVQPIQNSFVAVGKKHIEAASTLGASPVDRFFTVVVPLAAPGFLTAATLGFAHVVGEFGVILMIGGNIPGKTRVISTAIFDHVESMQYEQAHTLAAGIVLFSATVLLTIRLVNSTIRKER